MNEHIDDPVLWSDAFEKLEQADDSEAALLDVRAPDAVRTWALTADVERVVCSACSSKLATRPLTGEDAGTTTIHVRADENGLSLVPEQNPATA